MFSPLFLSLPLLHSLYSPVPLSFLSEARESPIIKSHHNLVHKYHQPNKLSLGGHLGLQVPEFVSIKTAKLSAISQLQKNENNFTFAHDIYCWESWVKELAASCTSDGCWAPRWQLPTKEEGICWSYQELSCCWASPQGPWVRNDKKSWL